MEAMIWPTAAGLGGYASDFEDESEKNFGNDRLSQTNKLGKMARSYK